MNLKNFGYKQYIFLTNTQLYESSKFLEDIVLCSAGRDGF